MATLVRQASRLRELGEASVMSSSDSTRTLQDAAGELTCISALLSLSSPKCSRSRDSSTVTIEGARRHKIPKLNSSAPTTPRGVTQPSLDPGSEAWVNKWVELRRGKYQGRKALIVGITAKKFRVRVVGVEHQLEFYPSMFQLNSSSSLIEVPSPGPNELQLHPALATPKSAVVKTVSLSREVSREVLPTQVDASQKTPSQLEPEAPNLSPIKALTEPVYTQKVTADAHSGASADAHLEEVSSPPTNGDKTSPSLTRQPNSGSTNGSRNHSANHGNIETEVQGHQ